MEKPEMEQIMKKAEVLIEALPYIQKFNRKIIVVKYGGSAMSNEELQKNVIKDDRRQGHQQMGGKSRQGACFCQRIARDGR